MNADAMKSLVICALGVALLGGCASSPSSSSVASAQRNVRSGKVAAVERTAIVDETVVGSSSGSSAVVTTASGGPSVVTVLFNDGAQGRYIIERPGATHRVGEPVYVITDGDRITMVPR